MNNIAASNTCSSPLDRLCHLLTAAILFAFVTAAPAALVGYWPMDEGTGTTSTADASSNNNTGTLNNMESNDWIAGHTGNAGDFALHFDQNEGGGTFQGEFVDCGTDASLDVSSAITMSAWINRDASKPHGHVINMGGGWSDPGYTMFVYNNALRTELQGNGTKTGFDNGGVASGTWQHIAIQWDRNGSDDLARVYFDGVLQGTQPSRTIDIAAATQNFQIGQNANQQQEQYNFQGAIDDVAVWNHALSAAEIQGLADGTYTPLTIPEPSSLFLIAFALLGLGTRRRRGR